jgi:hypothetical protein
MNAAIFFFFPKVGFVFPPSHLITTLLAIFFLGWLNLFILCITQCEMFVKERGMFLI